MPRRFRPPGRLGHEAKRLLLRARDTEVIQRVLRRQAAGHLDRLEPGAVTVVTASWNSNDLLEVSLAAARHFADRPLHLLVVDNHSAVPPTAVIRRYDARLVRLPANLGHGVALDIGFLLARTEYVMALDVDAFPYRAAWLPTFLDPLDHGATVSGCEAEEHFAHPCCLAMKTDRFVRARHTFVANMDRGWDVGQRISQIEGNKVHLVPKTGNLHGSGIVSASYGDVLYHNAYGTRHLRLANPDQDALDPTSHFAMTRQVAREVWAEATLRFGPDTWTDAG